MIEIGLGDGFRANGFKLSAGLSGATKLNRRLRHRTNIGRVGADDRELRVKRQIVVIRIFQHIEQIALLRCGPTGIR
ncbi:MAG: hypothetical protein ABJP08_00030 [Roseibium sp.]